MDSSITVRYFATFREITGREEERIPLEDPRPLDRIIEELIEQYPDIAGPLEHAAVALNYETVDPGETRVSPGDELALLPPFGGGSSSPGRTTEVGYTAFVENPSDFEMQPLLDHVRDPRSGGIATFTGTVRTQNEGRDVQHLEYECYPDMAREHLESIMEEAQQHWNDRGPLQLAAAHRTGRVLVGEPAVMVAVSAPHRAEALEACRYLIDELKQRVPIWKKEHFTDGEVWVENQPEPPGSSPTS